MEKMIGIISCNYHHQYADEFLSTRQIGALPFGGRYRMLDFALSSMVHSGIKTVGLINPQNYRPILDHLGAGKEWNLDRKIGGLFILPGADHGVHSKRFKLSLYDLIHNLEFLERDTAPWVAVSGSSNIFSIDFQGALKACQGKDFEVVFLYKEIQASQEEDPSAVALEVGEDGTLVRIKSSFPRPGRPYACFADALLIKRKALLAILEGYRKKAYLDLMDVLEVNIFQLSMGAVPLEGYFGRVFSKQSYFDRSMELLNIEVQQALFHGDRPVLTRIKDNPPTRYGALSQVSDALVSSGCLLEGAISRSLIFRGVQVSSGASVHNSVVMQKCRIGQGAILEHVILDKYVEIQPHTVIRGQPGNVIFISKNKKM